MVIKNFTTLKKYNSFQNIWNTEYLKYRKKDFLNLLQRKVSNAFSIFVKKKLILKNFIKIAKFNWIKENFEIYIFTFVLNICNDINFIMYYNIFSKRRIKEKNIYLVQFLSRIKFRILKKKKKRKGKSIQ